MIIYLLIFGALFLILFGISVILIWRNTLDTLNIILSVIAGITLIGILITSGVFIFSLSNTSRKIPTGVYYGGTDGGPVTLQSCDMGYLLNKFTNPESNFYLEQVYRITGDPSEIQTYINQNDSYIHIVNQPYFFDEDMSPIYDMLNQLPLNLGRNFDLLFPIGKPPPPGSLTGVGHYTLGIINYRCNGNCISNFTLIDPKREDSNPAISNRIYNEVRRFISEKGQINAPSQDRVRGCAIQARTDGSSCGYYVFKLIYNYLVLNSLGRYSTNEILQKICPGNIERKSFLGNLKSWGRALMSNAPQELPPIPYEREIDNEPITMALDYLTKDEKEYLLNYIRSKRLASREIPQESLQVIDSF